MQHVFIVEKYTNPDKTVEEAIKINCKQSEEYFHRERAFMRTQINQELTWLHEIQYLDEHMKVLYWDTFDIHGQLIKRDEPWIFGKSRYSKGGEIL